MSGLLLVSLDEFKSYKGISKSDKDARLMIILEGVSNYVKEYCKRSFIDYYSVDKVEYHDGHEFNQILLKEIPLISITKVEVSLDGDFTGTDPTKITELEAYTSYFPSIEDSLITSGSGYPIVVGGICGVPNIRVTYKAGYETVPKDLKIAIMDLTEYYYSEEYTPRKAYKDMSIENLGFREGTASLPSHVKRVFEMYRRLG